MKALVSLSGGMDSTTLLAWALNDCRGRDNVAAVSFDYGSKHAPWEMRAGQDVAAHYNVDRLYFDIRGSLISNSHLMRAGGAIPEGHYQEESMRQTVVPGRNMTFISIMAGFAEAYGFDCIYLGIHSGDHFIYPDCRPKFFSHMNDAVREATDSKVYLRAPFLHQNKTRIIEWGLRNGVPYHLTRTCYTDQRIACGKCGSCQERLEAFAANKLDDPINYATRELIKR